MLHHQLSVVEAYIPNKIYLYCGISLGTTWRCNLLNGEFCALCLQQNKFKKKAALMFSNKRNVSILPLHLMRLFSQSHSHVLFASVAQQPPSALSNIKSILKTHQQTIKPTTKTTANLPSTAIPNTDQKVDVKGVANTAELTECWNNFQKTELFLRYRHFFENWSKKEVLVSCFTHNSKGTLGIPSNGNLQFLGRFALNSILGELIHTKYSNTNHARNIRQIMFEIFLNLMFSIFYCFIVEPFI